MEEHGNYAIPKNNEFIVSGKKDEQLDLYTCKTHPKS